MKDLTVDLLEALLKEGYEVTFSPARDGVEAFVVALGAPGQNWTAVEDTLELALRTASPLYGGDDPMPQGTPDARPAAVRVLDAITAAVTALGDEVAEHDARLDALEHGQPRELGATVIDSHLWRCWNCNGQCIGDQPDSGLCKGCEESPALSPAAANPGEITIEVTADDILHGRPHDIRACPIALAARRVFFGDPDPGLAYDLTVSTEGIIPSIMNRDLFFDYPIPESARVFIQRFDQGCAVKPFTFVVRPVEP